MLPKRLLLIVALLLIAVLTAAGCGGGVDGGKNQQSQSNDKATGSSLEGLFAKDKIMKVKSMSFESVFKDESDNTESFAKMWIKGRNIKAEMPNPEGGVMITLIKPDAMYAVDLENKTAMKIALQQDKSIEQNNPLYFTESDIWNPVNFRDEGEAMFDGKKCRVLAFREQNSEWEKYYVWEEYGLPLKIERYENGKLIHTSEFKNITVNKVPDSEFELPAGIEILEMGNINVPVVPVEQ